MRPALGAFRGRSGVLHSAWNIKSTLGGSWSSYSCSYGAATASLHTAANGSTESSAHDAESMSQWAVRLAGVIAAGAAAAGGGASVAHQEASLGSAPPAAEKKGWSLISDASRTVTFFKYEKRLREHSNVDKVFDYFSTVSEGKHKYMTEGGLMRSVVPVFPIGSVRTGFLDGDNKVGLRPRMTRLGSTFDTDGNGLISFGEYIFFLQLMSISVEDLSIGLQMLDVDGSHTLSKAEMMAAVGSWSSGKGTDHTRTGLESGATDDPFLPALFGADGTKEVPLAKAREFLAALHDDVAVLEFQHYDYDETGYISGELFAYAAISAMPMTETDAYLKRMGALTEELKQSRVSRDDFRAFARLADHSETFRRAAEFWLERQPEMALEDFSRAIRSPCGTELSAAQLEILYALFQPSSKDEPPFPWRFAQMLSLRSIKTRAKATLATPGESIQGRAKALGLNSKAERR